MSNIGELKREITERYFRNTALDLTEWRAQFDNDVTKTVVNIPARSGSTRVLDKNIRKICGLPLMAYTILIARALPGVERVIVNTDSPVYAEIAHHYGAEVPFLRPLALATSKSSSYWAYYYLFRHLVDENYPAKTIVTLVPTSPFRNIEQLTRLLETLQSSGSVQSAFRVRTQTTNLFEVAGDLPQKLTLYNKNQMTVFKPLGIFSGQHIFRDHIFYKIIDFVSNPLELIDIDTESDILAMERVVSNKLYDFGIPLCVD